MNFAETPLWFRSLLCVAGLAAGMAAHLAFHPQRRLFSDALDLLKNQPRLLLLGGLLMLAQRLAGTDGFHPLPDAAAADWMDWRALAAPLAGEAALRFVTLPHQALPPWPAALLLPLLLAVVVLHLFRYPYRAGLRQRPRGGEIALLVVLGIVFTAQAGADLALSSDSLPEWLVNGLVTARLAGAAWFTAGCQVWLLCVVTRWLRPLPRSKNKRRPSGDAWWEMLGRWRLVLALAGFNLLWMALRSWLALSPSPLLPWLLGEMLLFFAPLPVAVALAEPGASFFQTGAAALRLLWRSLPGLLGLGLTAVVILALTHYADGMAGALAAEMKAWPVRAALQAVSAFALAFIHIWLFLAVALMFIRRSANSPSDPDPLPSR